MSDEKPKVIRQRKKKHAHEHHGGAWKVAYADFVTAMMALFLVLWLVSQADQKVKQQIAQYFRSPGVFDSTDGGILSGPRKVSKDPTQVTSKDEEQSLFQTATMLRKAFASRPEFAKHKDQVKVEVTEEGLKIDILDKAERVSFPSASAELTAEAKEILAEIARAICQLPNPVNIGGHTDRHVFPTGSGYTNWELSADRANAARRALEQGCLRAEQVRRVIGYADTELLMPEDPFSPANRRISIVVMRTQGTPPMSSDNKPVDVNSKTRVDAPAGRAESGSKNVAKDARLAEAQLKTEGSVKVGEPDKLPAVPVSKPDPKPASNPASSTEANTAPAGEH